MNEDRRIALLIDADNISEKYIRSILDEISLYGSPTYKRIYGDWTTPQMGKWKPVLLEHSITPIQQYRYTVGKNATDSAMIIDAMDILYSGKVDGFCLASSDSDFTKLATRLREAGMFVLGMGEKKTPAPFKAACETFKYLEVLAAAAEPEEEDPKKTEPHRGESRPKTGKEKKGDELETVVAGMKELCESIRQVINQNSDEEGWTYLSQIGTMLGRIYPDFDPRNYGYSKLHKLIEDTGMFEEQITDSGRGTKHYLFRNIAKKRRR